MMQTRKCRCRAIEFPWPANLLLRNAQARRLSAGMGIGTLHDVAASGMDGRSGMRIQDELIEYSSWWPMDCKLASDKRHAWCCEMSIHVTFHVVYFAPLWHVATVGLAG